MISLNKNFLLIFHRAPSPAVLIRKFLSRKSHWAVAYCVSYQGIIYSNTYKTHIEAETKSLQTIQSSRHHVFTSWWSRPAPPETSRPELPTLPCLCKFSHWLFIVMCQICWLRQQTWTFREQENSHIYFLGRSQSFIQHETEGIDQKYLLCLVLGQNRCE